MGRGEGRKEVGRKASLMKGKSSISLNLYNVQVDYFQDFRD